MLGETIVAKRRVLTELDSKLIWISHELSPDTRDLIVNTSRRELSHQRTKKSRGRASQRRLENVLKTKTESLTRLFSDFDGQSSVSTEENIDSSFLTWFWWAEKSKFNKDLCAQSNTLLIWFVDSFSTCGLIYSLDARVGGTRSRRINNCIFRQVNLSRTGLISILITGD